MTVRSWEIVLLVGIIGIAGFLRLSNLTSNPGWYSDEGTVILLADNRNAGKSEYLGLAGTPLIVARPPLFLFLLSKWMAGFSDGITALRSFTVSLNLISIPLLYYLVRSAAEEKEITRVAILTTALLGTSPLVVLYSRYGFSYNLLMPLMIVIVLGLWMFLERGAVGGLIGAAIAVGLGAISEIAMLSMVPLLFIIVLWRGKKHLLWVTALMLIPLVIYLGMEWSKDPVTLAFDLKFLSERVTSIPLIAQPVLVLINFYNLLMLQPWFGFGLIGIFLVRPVGFRNLILLVFFTYFGVLARTVAIQEVSIFYLIPLFPFFSIGIAFLIARGIPQMLDVFRSANLRPDFLLPRFLTMKGKWPRIIVESLLIFSIFLFPILFPIFSLFHQIPTSIRSPIESITLNPTDARVTASYINQLAGPQDLVISSPSLAWAFDMDVTDFQISLASKGVQTAHFPGTIPSDRFVFPVGLEDARFVIVDPVWRNWALPNIPPMRDYVAVVWTWPLVHESGQIQVFQNPQSP